MSTSSKFTVHLSQFRQNTIYSHLVHFSTLYCIVLQYTDSNQKLLRFFTIEIKKLIWRTKFYNFSLF